MSKDAFPLHESDALLHLDDEDILALVQSDARKLRRQIRGRDVVEIVACALVAVMIGPAVMVGAPLTRAGAAVMLGGIALVVIRLVRARRAGRPDAAEMARPVAAVLQAERQRVDAQIRLLDTVLWWYVGPLMLGSIMMVAGRRGASWFTAFYIVAVVLMSWGIVALNAIASKRTLRPRREELTKLLDQLES